MRSFFSTVILLSFCLISFSQDINYAKFLIDSLASPSMHGRGYVHNSDLTAANFIKTELQTNGILPFDGDYFQKYNINVNTFPGKVEVSLDKKKLVPAVDYLIWANSPDINGKYKIAILDAKIISDNKKFKKFKKQNHSNEFVFIDTVGANKPYFKSTYEKIVKHNLLKAKGVIVVQNKNLTYRPSQTINTFPVVEIKRQSLTKSLKTIDIEIESEYLQNYQTQNIIGYIEGEVDSFLVFTAHYDHIGRMGKNTYFPGANDNASGVAMVLDLSKQLASQKTKPHYSIAVMLFSGEELGLLGSKYYTKNPIFDLEKIKFLINLDMVGSGEKGIKIVNGKVFIDDFNKLKDINNEKKYLADVKIRGAAANSDHYFFYDKGVKCFFIYTLGEYKEYHNIYDKAEAVPLIEYEDLFRLLLDFINN